MIKNKEAIIFDAYGTLFDVNVLTNSAEFFFPGKGMQISAIWRGKQLEYSWLRTLMGRYADFWNITKDALTYACKAVGENISPVQLSVLMNEYLTLPVFSEVPQTLKQLTETKQLAILSNGTKDMLIQVAENAKVESYFNHIISVDEIKQYKPNLSVYQLAVDHLEVTKDEILFVTSNPWDASGAKTFGFEVCWVNRSNKPFDELGVRPDFEVKSLLNLI